MDVRGRFDGALTLDGGLASELERRGADLRDRLWSARILLEDPDLIRAVHAEYFAAGADVAISASYQASFEGFAERGLSREQAAGMMRRSVDLAREAAGAAGNDRIVAASVGPYGAVLADGSEYVGRYGLSVRQLIDFHEPRIEALLEAGPDLLAIETIPSILEAEALVTILDGLPDVSAWISFSCPDGEHISDGTPFLDAATVAAASPRVVAVGVNCSPPVHVPALLSSVRVDTPLLAYPNLGSTWDATAKSWILEGPRPDLGTAAASWRAAGARIVGGCCGTTPDDIRAIAAGR
jgi:homocysteine S-methyltransferase